MPAEKRYPCAGIRFFRWPEGIVECVEGVGDCLALPWVEEIEVKVTQGKPMPSWRDSTDRPGYVVVGGESAEEVLQRLTLAEQLLKVRYREL